MVCALIVGHGQFGQCMRSALEQIVGELEGLETMSTLGRGRGDIEAAINGIRGKFQGEPLIVFTDLQGGCSTTVCGSMLRNVPDVGIICGVNLPMLVRYVHYRETTPLPELYRLVVEAGQDGIKGLKQPG